MFFILLDLEEAVFLFFWQNRMFDSLKIINSCVSLCVGAIDSLVTYFCGIGGGVCIEAVSTSCMIRLSVVRPPRWRKLPWSATTWVKQSYKNKINGLIILAHVKMGKQLEYVYLMHPTLNLFGLLHYSHTIFQRNISQNHFNLWF